MVMDFKNWNDLKKAIEKKTKKSLETNVKDLVRKETNEQIHQNSHSRQTAV